jgi:hypothetical protein
MIIYKFQGYVHQKQCKEKSVWQSLEYVGRNVMSPESESDIRCNIFDLDETQIMSPQANNS